MTDTSIEPIAAAAIRRPHARSWIIRRCLGACRTARWSVIHIPLFTFVLIAFVAVKLGVADPRSIAIPGKYYMFTYVELLYLFGAFCIVAELVKVSKPGIDNTWEAILMLLVSIVYLVLYVLSLSGAERLAIFRDAEFLMLMLLSFLLTVGAFVVNARTLKRTIDYSSDHASQ